MAIDRFYTPQALSEATGLNLSQCRSLIAQSPERICVSRNPDSKKPRWAISERGFQELMAEHRRKAMATRKSREQPTEKGTQRRRKTAELIPGLNPDGTLMNSRQLKAAGLWNR